MAQQRSYKIEDFSTNVKGEVDRLKSQVDLFWDKEIKCYTQFGLKDGMSILECGCGPGYVSEKILDKFPNITSTAIEIDTYLIDILKQNIYVADKKRCKISQQSVTDLGFKENSFDFVITRLVIEHLPDPGLAVKEVYRVLKPGGKAVFVDNDFGLHLKTSPEILELNKLYDAYCESRIAEGGNPKIGRELPVILKNGGFCKVDLEIICAHSCVNGDEKFLESEGVGIPSQLVKDGYLSAKILDQLAVRWHNLLNNKQHSIFRQLFVAVGEKSINGDFKTKELDRFEKSEGIISPDKFAHKSIDKKEVVNTLPHVGRKRLLDYLTELVVIELGCSKENVGCDTLINDLGFDSLMAVEVINRSESDLGIDMSLMDFFEGQSMNDIVQIMFDKLLSSKEETSEHTAEEIDVDVEQWDEGEI